MSHVAREGRVTRDAVARAQVAQRAELAQQTQNATEQQRVSLRRPFTLGFFAAAGALVAWWLGTLILSVSGLLVVIVVALFLAAGLNPLVELLGRRGVKRSYAVLVVILGVLAAIALFLFALVPVITDQVSAIVENAPGWLEALRGNPYVEQLDGQFGIIAKIQEYVTSGSFGEQVFGGVVGVGVALLSALGNAFIIIVLTLYFLASLPKVKRAAYQLAPASKRERVGQLGDRIVANIGAYVSGAFLVGVCAGVTSLIFLLIVGLSEYAVSLALVVALLDVIPMIGATLGAVIVTAIGFATDPKIGLACLIFYVAYQQIENYAIYPRVMSRSVNIPGSVIVIAALVGAGLLGVVGALLAIPTAAAILLILREVVVPRLDTR